MFPNNSDAERTNLSGGLSRKILAHDEKIMAVEVSFEKGAVGAMHSHPHSQISYVLSGRFLATVGNETREISVGDTYVTAPGEAHGVTCLEPGTLLDVFTPAREDFLK